MSITRTLVAALAAGALVVPAAQAATPPAGAPGGKPVPAERGSGAMAAESASERPAAQPSAPAAKATDGGVDGASLAIGIAGTLVAAGGVAAVGTRRRRLRPAV